MRVLVTGGTGFVGSHSVAALVRSGHEVRLLVRSPQRIASALEPVDVHEVDSAEGDVTDPVSVERAMEGCEAVLHAASVYSFRRRDAKLMEETNARGTDLVLATAQRLGLDPIVYVSSYVALLPANGRVLTAESPLGTPSPAYARSKADSERVARGYQDAGAPVAISYPAMVWGPHDPHLGESNRLAVKILRGRLPLIPDGGVPIVDVRDVAQLHAQLIERGRGPRRYMAGGAYVPFPELVDSLARATGRAIRHRALPDLLARLMARFNEAIYSVRQAARCDDSRTRDEFGIIPRDPEETLTDSVRWLAEQGHINAREAGNLAT
jgi:dihydroflavonol-4-reductase